MSLANCSLHGSVAFDSLAGATRERFLTERDGVVRVPLSHADRCIQISKDGLLGHRAKCPAPAYPGAAAGTRHRCAGLPECPTPTFLEVVARDGILRLLLQLHLLESAFDVVAVSRVSLMRCYPILQPGVPGIGQSSTPG